MLAQIWNLADIDKDGKLDKKEFSIACYLIKKVLTSSQSSSILPSKLPSSLLIEPSLMPNRTSSNLQPQLPLFQATFPSTLPPLNASVSNLNAVSMTGGVSLFPNLNNMNNTITPPLMTSVSTVTNTINNNL